HVEDDVEMHHALRNMAGGGYDFVLATTLREARARVALQQFDVVILDLGLPNESGWDLLLEIRNQQPQARVVVLAQNELQHGLAGAVDAVLQKSRVSAQSLMRAISTPAPVPPLSERP